MLDETKAHRPCWLVWVLERSGETTLRAVDLTAEIAERHRLALVAEERYVRVYVESSLANHLYGGLIDISAIRAGRAYVAKQRSGD